MGETGPFVADGLKNPGDQQLSAGGSYCFGHGGTGCFGYSLVALAMVIGANIEYGMIFAVVPADVFGIGFDKGEKAFVFVTQGLAFLYLGKQPAA